MELFSPNIRINFMGKRKLVTGISLLVFLLSLLCIYVRGINFGLDFTGGTQLDVRFQHQVQPNEIKRLLLDNGFDDVKVRHYGAADEVMLRLPNVTLVEKSALVDKIESALSKQYKDFETLAVDYVGAEVGEQLAKQGIVAVIVAIITTMVYISFRFEHRFAISAALALCHDATLIVGYFSLFRIEFDLATLAAILAVVGYSLNDTIVVFDRVRESFRRAQRGKVADVINIAINQTLSRTIMTSWLTLIVVLTLLFVGGESLYGFSLALTLGVIIGTYSSVYVAGGLAIELGLTRADMLARPKVAVDNSP